jgi:hypothetical protein
MQKLKSNITKTGTKGRATTALRLLSIFQAILEVWVDKRWLRNCVPQSKSILTGKIYVHIKFDIKKVKSCQ